MHKQVQIVIPIYKTELSILERQSLRQIHSIMMVYNIVIIKPESLDLEYLKDEYSKLKFESFDDSFFSGIEGYNKLMLSTVFYKRFLDSKFILVSQLDAYIFNDNLTYFIDKGYDYIGAPWLKRRLYRIFPFLEKIKLMKKKYNRKNITWSQNTNNCVGNGGFSLRNVKRFYDATLQYSERIAFYTSHTGLSLYNEDVFWAKEPLEFNYPSIEEALKFSFDKYPALCFTENGKKLPMGCHGWYKWKWRGFWKKHIKFEDKK